MRSRRSLLWISVALLAAQHLAYAQLTAAQTTAPVAGPSPNAASDTVPPSAPNVPGPASPAQLPEVTPTPVAAQPVAEPVASAPVATPNEPPLSAPNQPPPPPIGVATSMPAPIEELQQKVDAMSHLKITGFVQAQYVRNDASKDAVDSSGKPLNKDIFEVRRARLRATYTLGLAEFVLNVDAIPAGVTVKEAEGSMTIPWSDEVRTKVTAGLMYIPWGYESQESDSVLPFIERSMLSNRLFPGQRDIGVRAAGNLFNRTLEYQFAVMNGNPISDAVFPAVDPNSAKDVIGRVGVNVGGLRAGVSGLVGKGFLPPGVDDPKTTTLNEAHSARSFPHRAAAFDVTFTHDLPVIGQLALYTEGVIARNLDRSTLGDYPKPVVLTIDGNKAFADGAVAGAKQLGGYVGFLQHLGPYVAVGARGEIFDPSTSKHNNTLGALTLTGHVYPHELVRLTVAYQANYENPKVKNNIFWLRGQVKF
jgi:hypothetical protein